MQITVITMAFLFLLAGGFFDAALLVFHIQKRLAALCAIGFCVCALIPWQVHFGKFWIAPLSLASQILFCVLLLKCTKPGWQRYRIALCVCLLCVTTALCASGFIRSTEEILQEHTAFAAFVIAAAAFVFCPDVIGGLCAAVLGTVFCNLTLGVVHWLQFSDPVYLGFAHSSLCMLYCVLYILLFQVLCGYFNHIVMCRKRLRS